METILLIVHVIISIVLIVSILLQSSKGGGLSGGAFGGMGGGGGGAIFGGGGANAFLVKVTTYAGIAFALTCVGLWYTGRGADTGFPQSAAERALQERGGVPVQSQQAGPQPLQLNTPQEAVESTTPADTSSAGGN